MKIFAKHFWEKERKLQEILKTDTWHFNTNKNKKSKKRIQDQVFLHLCYIGICLSYQNLDTFLQRLQFEHNSVCAKHCAESFRDITLVCRVVRYFHFKVLELVTGKERIWKQIWPILKACTLYEIFLLVAENETSSLR